MDFSVANELVNPQGPFDVEARPHPFLSSSWCIFRHGPPSPSARQAWLIFAGCTELSQSCLWLLVQVQFAVDFANCLDQGGVYYLCIGARIIFFQNAAVSLVTWHLQRVCCRSPGLVAASEINPRVTVCTPPV